MRLARAIDTGSQPARDVSEGGTRTELAKVTGGTISQNEAEIRIVDGLRFASLTLARSRM